MAIRLETSQRTGIDNHQDSELTASIVAWAKKLSRQFPSARRRTDASAGYNCHGLTFASRRAWVYRGRDLQRILADDQYAEVELPSVLAGDIVIYRGDDGDFNHSGIVVEAGGDLIVPLVCSKWAHAGEYIHALRDCPAVYGPHTTFFRCVR